MPPKVELDEEKAPSFDAWSAELDGREQGEMHRWALQNDLSGRRDMHANAGTARAAAFLMQLSASANCVVLLIGIVRMLQVRAFLHFAYLLPPVYCCPHFALKIERIPATNSSWNVMQSLCKWPGDLRSAT